MDESREQELLNRIGRYQEAIKNERNLRIAVEKDKARLEQELIDLSREFEALKTECSSVELKRKKPNQVDDEPPTSNSNRNSVYCFYNATTLKVLEFGKDAGTPNPRDNSKIFDTLNNTEGAKFEEYRQLLQQGKLGILRVFTELDRDTAKIYEFLLIRTGKEVGECIFNERNGSCDVPGYELKTAKDLDKEGDVLLEEVRKMFGKQHVYSFGTIQNYKPAIQKRMRFCTGECGQLKNIQSGTVCRNCQMKANKRVCANGEKCPSYPEPVIIKGGGCCGPCFKENNKKECKDPKCNRAGQKVQIKARGLCETCYNADRSKPKTGD